MFYVINRSGEHEQADFSKIQNKITLLAAIEPKLENVDPALITRNSVGGLSSGVHVSEIDEYTASVASNMVDQHFEYDIIAARILVNNLQKTIKATYSEMTKVMYEHRVEQCRGQAVLEPRHVPLVSAEYYQFVMDNAEQLDAMVAPERDYRFGYAGMVHMIKKYFIRTKEGRVLETPATMFLRVAVGIYFKCPGNTLGKIANLYDLMSRGYCTHATPTLYNAGTRFGQLSSCFLIGSPDDTAGLMKVASDCAIISKYAGGIGIHNNWRGNGSYIAGTCGTSNGKIPFLNIYSAVSKAFDQGGGKRKGSFAVYERIFDSEIERFLKMRMIIGASKERDHVLFPAVWIPDLFMKRLRENGVWSLFSSDDCPRLFNTTCEEFEALYLEYESKKYWRKQVSARSLFEMILDSKVESGLPYILYADNANRFSNQQNLGVIHSSNLCAEIIMYSDEKEYGTCNLASICLGRFVRDRANPNQESDFPEDPYFDFDQLSHVTGTLVDSLNAVIDNNWYPLPETKLSNMSHRPIGIGVQGLADVFAKCHIPFDSPEARLLNKQIFECMYYMAVSKSTYLARINRVPGQPKTSGAYSTFTGSPLSKGLFRWQLSGLTPDDLTMKDLDWDALRQSVMAYGVRNSLHIALMPTASTSFIMNQVECFEPVKTNFGTRRTDCGTFWVVNKYLMNDLLKLGLYSPLLGQNITVNNGSIQHLRANLGDKFADLYKTAFEYDQLDLVKMAADRQHFVDQSQSLNIYGLDVPNKMKLLEIHYLGWKQGLITGSYYYHQLPATKPIPFTINAEEHDKLAPRLEELMRYVSEKNVKVDACEMCGS